MADKDQCVKTVPWVLAGDMVEQLRVSCTGNPLRDSGHRGSKLDEGFWAQGV